MARPASCVTPRGGPLRVKALPKTVHEACTPPVYTLFKSPQENPARAIPLPFEPPQTAQDPLQRPAGLLRSEVAPTPNSQLQLSVARLPVPQAIFQGKCMTTAHKSQPSASVSSAKRVCDDLSATGTSRSGGNKTVGAPLAADRNGCRGTICHFERGAPFLSPSACLLPAPILGCEGPSSGAARVREDHASALTATELTDSPSQDFGVWKNGRNGGNGEQWGEMGRNWGNLGEYRA